MLFYKMLSDLLEYSILLVLFSLVVVNEIEKIEIEKIKVPSSIFMLL